MIGISYTHRSTAHDQSHRYLFPVVNDLLGNRPAGSTLLDLGCGNGSFLSLFASRGWYLTGIDLSPTGIQLATESFPEIRFFLADATSKSCNLLATIGQVDAIISTEVIEHLYDPRTFLSNAYNLLKPGAVIVLTTPYHGYLKNLMLALTGKLDSHFTVLWDHGHIKFWSYKTLRQAMSEAGFTDIEFHGSGRLPFLWKSMVLKAVKPDVQALAAA